MIASPSGDALLDWLGEEAVRVGTAALEGIEPGTWPAARERTRARLVRSLGLDRLPAGGSGSGRLAGVVDGDGCRIERLVIEPLRGVSAPSLLYLPVNGVGPFPAVVVAVGHWIRHGKTTEHVQAVCTGLARRGIAALAMDPIGQGERDAGFELHRVPQLLPLGLSQAGLRVWELTRLVDYLVSRPDIDGTRIGITGASGGGLATVFAAAVDSRFRAVVPVCFVSSYDRFLRVMRGLNWNGRGDLCNQIPGVVANTEMAGACALISPRPLLVINGSRDPQFPARGAAEVVDRLQPLYEDAPAALRLHVVDAGHGYDRLMREAAYGWFLRWLGGSGAGDPVPEGDLVLYPEGTERLRCLDRSEQAGTTQAVRDLVRTTAHRLGAGQGRVQLGGTRIDPLRRVLGLEEAVVVDGSPLGTGFLRGTSVEHHVILPVGGISLPLARAEPTGRPGAPVVLLSDGGMDTAESGAVLNALLATGSTVYLFDPRGVGATAPNPPPSVTLATLDGGLEQVTPSRDEHLEFEVATNCIMLGRSLLGQQAADVLAATAYVRRVHPAAADGGSPSVVAVGTLSSLRAAFAVALEPSIRAAWLDRVLLSFGSLVLAPTTALSITTYLVDILSEFDLGDVLALAADRRITVSRPVDGSGAPLPASVYRSAYAEVARAAEAAGGRFVVLDAGPAGADLSSWR